MREIMNKQQYVLKAWNWVTLLRTKYPESYGFQCFYLFVHKILAPLSHCGFNMLYITFHSQNKQ